MTPGWRRLPRRAQVFAVLLAVYVVLTLGVIFSSPVLTLDSWIVGVKLQGHPGLVRWLTDYVILGQRKPAIRVFFPFFVWVALRKRSSTPLILLLLSLLLLNVSVGVVKLATGRLSPRATSNVHAVFTQGGDIYPSGHVSNAVVLFGMMALLALRFRRTAVVLAALLSFTIGIATLFLGTHWFSDVLGGWLAGGLVMLVIAAMAPHVDRAKDRVVAWARIRWTRAAAVAASTLFVAGISLSWVYFDIKWSVPLAIATSIVLLALILPGFAPPIVARLGRLLPQRASVPAADRPGREPARQQRTGRTAVPALTVPMRPDDADEGSGSRTRTRIGSQS